MLFSFDAVAVVTKSYFITTWKSPDNLKKPIRRRAVVCPVAMAPAARECAWDNRAAQIWIALWDTSVAGATAVSLGPVSCRLSVAAQRPLCLSIQMWWKSEKDFLNANDGSADTAHFLLLHLLVSHCTLIVCALSLPARDCAVAIHGRLYNTITQYSFKGQKGINDEILSINKWVHPLYSQLD